MGSKSNKTFFRNMFLIKNEKTAIFSETTCCTFSSLVFCGLPHIFISNKMLLNWDETGMQF